MSTKRLLYGVTHIVITTAPSAVEYKESGVFATADLCFGPDTANAISCIDAILAPDKTIGWRLPSMTYMRKGKEIRVPIFQGALAVEIGHWASLAIDRIKKQIGTPKFSRIYTIPVGSSAKVEEAFAAESKDAKLVAGEG
jgi:hypothetical protein